MVLFLLAAFGGGILFVSLVLLTLYAVRGRIPAWKNLWFSRYGKALKEEWKGHDYVAEVEWNDETVTFIGADYDPDNYELRLRKPFDDLRYKVIGQGGSPVYISGVPVIRIKAMLAAPIDSEVAVAMEMEEDDQYLRVDEHGNELDEQPANAPDLPDPDRAQQSGPAATASKTQGSTTVADGGVAVDDSDPSISGPGDVDLDDAAVPGTEPDAKDHIYNLKPEDWPRIQGYTFSLTSVAQRVPYPVSPQDLKRAEDRGRDSAGLGSDRLPDVLLGAGLMFILVVLFLAVGIAAYHLLGMGSSGALLLAVAAPGQRRVTVWGDP